MHKCSCERSSHMQHSHAAPGSLHSLESSDALVHIVQDMYHVDFLGKAASVPPDADALTAAANPIGSRAGIGASRYTSQSHCVIL